jgi:dephospho-CoA kinase
MIKIGLTGGIGTGKSVCAKIFNTIGIPIYDSDARAKRLMTGDIQIITAIKDLLGDQAYTSEHTLNRSYIASEVFKNQDLLSQLNGIVHPAVKLDFLSWAGNQKSPYILQESALLFEIKGEKKFDKVIVVDAPIELRIQRVMSRDRISQDQVWTRINKQMEQKDKVVKADFVILNDGSSSLIRQVLDIHQEIISKI